MPTMVLKANSEQALLVAILNAVTPFAGARAAAEKAIADAATAEDKTADVHIDEIETWKKHGWEVAPSESATK